MRHVCCDLHGRTPSRSSLGLGSLTCSSPSAQVADVCLHLRMAVAGTRLAAVSFFLAGALHRRCHQPAKPSPRSTTLAPKLQCTQTALSSITHLSSTPYTLPHALRRSAGPPCRRRGRGRTRRGSCPGGLQVVQTGQLDIREPYIGTKRTRELWGGRGSAWGAGNEERRHAPPPWQTTA